LGDFKSRIFNGKLATEGERKYQLWIKRDPRSSTLRDGPNGGATLIKKNWALTAAHVVDLCGMIMVGGGSRYWDAKKSTDVQSTLIPCHDYVFVHENYKRSKIEKFTDGYGRSFNIHW